MPCARISSIVGLLLLGSLACTSGGDTTATSIASTPAVDATASPTAAASATSVPALTPSPAPPPALDDHGLPLDATGPLLVYLRRPGGRDELVVHDLGTDRELYVISSPAASTYIAGTRLVVPGRGSLWSTAVDGTGRIDLWPSTDGFTLENIVPSPDGTLVAFNVACESPDDCPGFELPNHIYIVQTATGALVAGIEQTADLPPDFYGTASPIGWRDANHVALGGHFHRDGGGGDAAILSIDGTIEVIRDDPERGISSAWNRALGRPQPEFVGNAFCSLGGAQGLSRVALTDHETSVELNAIEADAPVFDFFGFGPRGWNSTFGEVLVRELIPDHATRAEWRERVAAGDCTGDFNTDWAAFPTVWWILSADGSPPRRVADELEAHRQWEGDRLITYACNGIEVLAPYDLASTPGGCDPRVAVIEIRLGGSPVITAPGPEVIGLIDIDESAED